MSGYTSSPGTSGSIAGSRSWRSPFSAASSATSRRWGSRSWQPARPSGNMEEATGWPEPSRRRWWRPASSPPSRGRNGCSGSRDMASRHVHVVQRDVPPELQARMAAAVAAVFVAFALVGTRLWYLQVERGQEMRLLSENNRIRLVRVPAARGVVYDRNGEILIDNRPSFDVVFVPEDARDQRRQVLRNLAGYLGEEETTLHQAVRTPAIKRLSYEGIVLRRDVDWQG